VQEKPISLLGEGREKQLIEAGLGDRKGIKKTKIPVRSYLLLNQGGR